MFLLYLGMGSMVMLFSSLSSALIVRKGDFKNWQEVILPINFLWSTIVILISSVTIYLANKAIDKTNFRLWSMLTLILALIFVFMQYQGWQQLKADGNPFTGHPSGSFIYVISFIHAFHYLMGIGGLIILDRLYGNRSRVLEYNLYYNILERYWHFIGIVWVYLFILFKFFIYN